MNGWRALDESACGQFQWPGLESRRSAAQEPRPHVRGKGLGGSSVVNGMIAIHAMADDYEHWAAEGCPGWTFEDILPYRRRMESDLNFGDRPYHGSDGPMPIQRLAREEWGPLDEALAESAAAQGHEWCEDHSAPTGHRHLAVRHQRPRRRARDDQRRISRARARSREPPDRRRRTGRQACLLEGGRAVGVRARIGEEDVEVRADKVVLCAGAVALPRDPAAVGHRPGWPGRPAARRREHAGAPARAVLVVPSPRRASGPRRTPGQLRPALLVRPRGRGRERHDHRVGQPDARPARRRHLAPGGGGPRPPGPGAGPAAARRRVVPGCCACGSTSSSATAGSRSRRRIRMSTR